MEGDYCCEAGDKAYCFLREFLTDDTMDRLDVPGVFGSEHTIGKGALPDVTDNCGRICARKQFLSKLSTRRTIEQVRCVADYKLILENANGRDFSLNEAMRRWVADGFAIKFAEVYNEDKRNGKIIRHKDLSDEAGVGR